MATKEMRISNELKEALKREIRKSIMTSPIIKKLIGAIRKTESTYEVISDPRNRLAWLN